MTDPFLLIFPLCLSLILFLIAIIKRTQFWGWLALAISGQAALLQMIDAGKTLHYQHFLRIDQILQNKPYLLLILAIQVCLVSYGIGVRWKVILPWLRQHFQTWQILGVAAGLFLSSTALSRSLTTYSWEILFSSFLVLVNLGNAILIAWTIPESWASGQLSALFTPTREDGFSKAGKRKSIIDGILFAGISWTFLTTAFLSFFVYQRHPHIPDEVIYLYQARYFAEARLTTPAYPVPEAFSLYLVPYLDRQWYSPFPPGWPAILSLGVKTGGYWLINPFLAALCIFMAFILTQKLYDTPTARWLVLLMCCSPWFIFMGMNLMSHMFMLAATLAACLGITLARDSQKWGWASLAGLATGVVAFIRPLDGMVLFLLLGLWALGLGGKRLHTASVLMYGVGMSLMVGILLVYNMEITGDFLTFPLNKYYQDYFGPNVYAFGFGADRGLNWAIDPYPGYSPIEALINAGLNAFSVNTELLGWAFGSLLFGLLFLMNAKFLKNDLILIVFILSVIASYSMFWFSGGPDFGARYWFLIIVPLLILSIRGIQITSEKVTAPFRLHALVWILCFLTLIVYFPWRAMDKYYHYLNMRPDIAKLSDENGLVNSLVFVLGNAHPDYASAWIYNPLDPKDKTNVFALDVNLETRAQVIQAFPGKRVWFIAGPTITGNGFRVLEGPLAPADALKWQLNQNEE